ncbi:MAG: DJ-1/PfpI family protein [Eubacterium sp.]|nr:DJ-1/PfpI family protein [Eubacterium sp.]
MNALVALADGFETVEALMTVDILRRGGVEVTTASITENLEVVSSQDITVKADTTISGQKAADYDVFILPGGQPGTTNLSHSDDVKRLLEEATSAGKKIAAICAAPTVFGQYGYLEGKKACCYPGLEEQLTGGTVTMNPVTIDGNVITSRGLGTALDFALAILEEISSHAKAAMIKKSVVA